MVDSYVHIKQRWNNNLRPQHRKTLHRCWRVVTSRLVEYREWSDRCHSIDKLSYIWVSQLSVLRRRCDPRLEIPLTTLQHVNDKLSNIWVSQLSKLRRRCDPRLEIPLTTLQHVNALMEPVSRDSNLNFNAISGHLSEQSKHWTVLL